MTAKGSSFLNLISKAYPRFLDQMMLKQTIFKTNKYGVWRGICANAKLLNAMKSSEKVKNSISMMYSLRAARAFIGWQSRTQSQMY